MSYLDVWIDRVVLGEPIDKMCELLDDRFPDGGPEQDIILAGFDRFHKIFVLLGIGIGVAFSIACFFFLITLGVLT